VTASSGRAAVVEKLLEHAYIQVHATTQAGCTPLQTAEAYGTAQVADQLRRYIAASRSREVHDVAAITAAATAVTAAAAASTAAGWLSFDYIVPVLWAFLLVWVLLWCCYYAVHIRNPTYARTRLLSFYPKGK
jgi:RsiW-degrading membrane proteinase PrsW (M82 family)